MTIAAVSWTSGTNKAAYSDDGDTWVRATAPSGSWERVTQNGASGFVAVGGGGAMYSTDNARTWSSGSISAGGWRGVCAVPGGFVAVAQSGPNYAATSTTGSTWTTRTISSGYWRGCTYGAGTVVAVEGFTGSPSTRAAYSTNNGVTWSYTTCPSGEWLSVTYAHSLGLFVAVAVGGTNRAMTSPDGVTWTARTIASKPWRDIEWDGSNLWAVEFGGQVHTSPTGTSWSLNTTLSGSLTGLGVEPSGQISVSSEASTRLFLSDDGGTTWGTPATPVSDTWADIAGSWRPPDPLGGFRNLGLTRGARSVT